MSLCTLSTQVDNRAWWGLPTIPALGRQGQEDPWSSSTTLGKSVSFKFSGRWSQGQGRQQQKAGGDASLWAPHCSAHTARASHPQIQALLQKENLFLEYSHITKPTMACEHTPRGGQGRAAGVTYGRHLTSSHATLRWGRGQVPSLA